MSWTKRTLFAVALGAAGALGFGQSLTIDQAIAGAIKNQPLIMQAQAAVQASEARIGESQSHYYPSVSGTADYAYVQPNEAVSLGPTTFSLAPVNNFDFHLGLNQVVYEFGKTGIQVKIAQSAKESALIGVDQITSSLAFQTAQTFYGALFLDGETKSLDDQLADLKEHLDSIMKKEQTGSATKFDVLTTQVRVAALESQRIDVANQFQKQVIALKQLIGMKPDDKVDLQGSFTPATVTGDSQGLITKAFAERPETRMAQEAVNAAGFSRDLATKGGLPTVSVQAEIGYKNGLLTANNTDINALTFNWVAGVDLDVPIFSGFLNDKAIDEAGQRLTAAQDASQAQRQQITTQVLQAIQDVAAGHDMEETSLVQVQQAQQALDQAKVQYDLGVTTNVEYLDAQTALSEARLTNLLALYHEVLSGLELRQAIGDKIWLPGA